MRRMTLWLWRRVHRRLARAGLPPSGLCLFIAAVWGDCTESGFGERGCVEVASVRRRWECVFARRCASCRGRASPSVRVTASCGGRERRRVRLWWGAAPALVHFLRVAWCAMVWGWKRRNRRECCVGGFAFSMGGPVCVCCGSCVHVRPLQAQPRVHVCMGHVVMMASVGASFGLDLQGRASVFGQKRGEQCWRPVGGERDSSSRRSAPRQLHVSRGFGD
jgi:hypothetical protein